MDKLKLILRFVILLSLLTSCKEKSSPPSVKTIPISEISYTSAIGGGEIINDGGSPIISIGLCWSTKADPTINDYKTSERII